MSVTIEAKTLRAAASEIAAVALSGGGEPAILANMIVEAEGPHLRLYASDLELAMERQVDLAQGDLGGGLKTTVPAKMFAAIAGKLPAEAQVSLSLSNGRLNVAAGRARFDIATLPAEEFPRFVDEPETVTFEIGRRVLADLIDSTAFAVSADETRYYLLGIFLHAVTEDGLMWLRAAATDGHRLARFQMPLPDGAADLTKGVIVPKKAVGLIRKLCEHETEEPVTIAVGERRIRVELGATMLVSKLIDGQFPDYARIVPTANTRKLAIDRAVLRAAVERVSVMATDKVRAVKFDLAKDLLTITVVSLSAGTATEEVPCDYDGEPLTVGFNAKYLLDLLGAIGADAVAALLGEANAPVRVAGDGDEQRLFVLMPMRV